MNSISIAVPLTLLVVATICDLRKREVPDWISLAILSWGVVAVVLDVSDIGWLDLLLGVGLGLGLGIPFFYFGGLGGGDVKLIAAMGAVLGPAGLLVFLFWVAILGGLLAIAAALRGRRDFAYVPAIAAGFAVYLVFPNGTWWGS